MRMICCWCRETTAKSPCSHCRQTPELDGRWRLIKSLGVGAAGETFLAESKSGSQRVAIKELSFRRLVDFKQQELFEREAKVLKSLRHRGIPDYLEDFTVEEGRHVGLYLVQELIEGDVLVAKSPTDERTVLEMMRELVDVLAYLESRRPSVIHRDIKPSNIMRRRDGSYVLIDFGTTRDSVNQTIGQSTVAGTLGYMAPEQLLGRATPASDVYGLAATAVSLLGAKDAAHLIDPHRPSHWRKHVVMSPGLADLLEKMLRVDDKRRLSDLSAIAKSLDKLLEVHRAMVVQPNGGETATEMETLNFFGILVGLCLALVSVSAVIVYMVAFTSPVAEEEVVPMVVEMLPRDSLFFHPNGVLVSISSRPSADVYFGGEKVGTTPMQTSLRAGTYTVTMKQGSKGKSHTFKVDAATFVNRVSVDL